MLGMPPRLIAGLSPADAPAAEAWWSGLSEAARSDVVALWDERQDRCFFGLAPHRDGAVPPVVIGGRFVPRDDDDAAGWAEWQAEYFQYLLNHSEVVFEPPVFRTFHIGCTRHEAAREALAAGCIPTDFCCPLDQADCRLRRLLDAPRHRPWFPWPRLAEALVIIGGRRGAPDRRTVPSGDFGGSAMRIEFRASEAGFEADGYVLNGWVSGTDADGVEQLLDLSRGPEDEDPHEDWGVHLQWKGQENGAYRCVRRCHLSRDRLTVDLSRTLRGLAGVEGFDVALAIDEPSFEQLRSGLPRIFRGMPAILEIA
jgi:hypothetical protein